MLLSYPSSRLSERMNGKSNLLMRVILTRMVIHKEGLILSFFKLF
ncbi:hypothetical protein [Sporolactobacillus shoreicorticis]|uniref:Transposase n=1 Tax=Sporolactobacillus shoreicorticis TaxID=1923877 RepID=A0ABW5SAX8_9BACL|nr:hypothetical protein [Sporolactobacillus shoreicorticis]